MKPLVAVVGRPNVGKSTFFNKLSGKRLSIVEDTPGVTRDRIYTDVTWLDYSFTLVDTGGLELKSTDEKLKFLENLPHIGRITANHLARNLGEDMVKYDIWIQRLGCVFGNKKIDVDNTKLNPEIKSVCDDMFAHLVHETGLPRGYIDVVLWRALQQGLIKL